MFDKSCNKTYYYIILYCISIRYQLVHSWLDLDTKNERLLYYTVTVTFDYIICTVYLRYEMRDDPTFFIVPKTHFTKYFLVIY